MQRESQSFQVDLPRGRALRGWYLPFLGLLVALCGLVVSAGLLHKHVAKNLGQETILDDVCEDEATEASCDEVIDSAWGTMYGQPTAWWGLVFFACMGAWYLAVGRPVGSSRAWNLLPFLAAAAGTAGCAWFAWIMYGTLKKWCPLCATTHVLSLLLFVISALTLWSSLRLGRSVIGSQYVTGRILVAVVLAAVTSALGWSEYHRRLETGIARSFEKRYREALRYQDELEEYESDYREHYDQFAAQKRVEIPLGDDESIRGNPDTPHTVVVFSDFECPACRLAETMIETQLEELPDYFHVVFKHFPFDRTCNPHVKNTLHRAACAAAVTAEAARKVNGDEAFWEFHDAFFANQKDFPKRMKDFVNETAEAMSIPSEELWAHINTTAAWDRIKLHVEQAHDLGVNRTPTIYLDGRPLTRWADPLFWRYLKKVDERAGQPVIPPDSQPASDSQVAEDPSEPDAELDSPES